MEVEEGSPDRGQGTCGHARSTHCAGRPCRRLRQLPRTSRRLIIFVALNETSFLLRRSCLFQADPSSMPQSVGSDTKAQGTGPVWGLNSCGRGGKRDSRAGWWLLELRLSNRPHRFRSHFIGQNVSCDKPCAGGWAA